MLIRTTSLIASKTVLLKQRRKNLIKSTYLCVKITFSLHHFAFDKKNWNTWSLSAPALFFRSNDNSPEVEEFDQNAAFFKVVSKKKKVGSIPEQPTGGKGKSKRGDNKTKEEDVC